MVRTDWETFYDQYHHDTPTDNYFCGLDAIGPIIAPFMSLDYMVVSFEDPEQAALVCELLNRLTVSDEFRVRHESRDNYHIYQKNT